jgi:catechol 2,3-dioxygenase-like lactoylglutathione lyase family enzyme
MPLVDHLSVGVNDIAKARSFYDPVLKSIGAECIASDDSFAAYGRDRIEFLLLKPFDGEKPTHGNGTHIAFAVSSEEKVSKTHQIAIEHGGKNEGEPGPRSDYPMSVFTAFVRDPVGNKLEIIFNGFSA